MVKALVVDDDKDFLRVVSKVLEAAGYSVTTSVDAIDALEKIQQENFDVVLTDANMPGASGFDFVKFIRGHERLSHIAIALLTGRRDKKDVDRGLECGADDYIVKPIDPDLFLSKVQSLLAKRPRPEVPEIGFAESVVNIDAKVDIGFKIIKVSEQGLTFRGPVVLTKNHKFRVKSILFEILGIESPTLRVIACEVNSVQPNMSTTTVSFIGLNDNELQKIRFWVNQHINSTQSKRVS